MNRPNVPADPPGRNPDLEQTTIRWTAEQRRRIAMAAAALEVTRTQFIVAAAVEKAETILAAA